MSRGLISYASYVPPNRLDRQRIDTVLGVSGPAGRRAVASFDEDSTTMAVEAARRALAVLPSGAADVRQLLLATASPAYLDKTNANAVHAALRLDRNILALDLTGSVRAGAGAIAQATLPGAPLTLVALADVRVGLPGSADEREGGDGAAALVFADSDCGSPVLAEILAGSSTSAEFLDRWRTPSRITAQVWEERFGEQQYLALGLEALDEALRNTGVEPAGVDHLVVTGTHTRAVKAFGRASGVPAAAVAPDLTRHIGNTGTAHAGIALADVLDRAGPGEVIAVVVLADGATATVLRTTADLPRHRQQFPVAAQIADALDVDYPRYLTWRGMLDREPPRRPDPMSPGAPASQRSTQWKFALVGAQCSACGVRLLPPGRVCNSCGAVDEMTPVPMAGVPARITTFTIDRLASVPNPPLLSAVVDFDGGGRLRLEVTDVRPEDVHIGLDVELVFRNCGTANGVHNYFWKARPARPVPVMEDN